MQKDDKNMLAVGASFFVPGLGQILKGHIGRGIGIMITGFLLFVSIFALIGLILYPLFWAVQLWDAYNLETK